MDKNFSFSTPKPQPPQTLPKPANLLFQKKNPVAEVLSPKSDFSWPSRAPHFQPKYKKIDGFKNFEPRESALGKKMLSKRCYPFANYFEKKSQETHSDRTVKAKICPQLFDSNFEMNSQKILQYLSVLPACQKKFLMGRLNSQFSFPIKHKAVEPETMRFARERPGHRVFKENGAENCLRRKKKEECAKCLHLQAIFKRLLDLKNNLYNRTEQTHTLLQTLKKFLPTPHVPFSGNLKEFLVNFLSSTSTEAQHKSLNMVDRILLLAVLIKKQFRFSGIRCFCFGSLKSAEDNPTKKRNDELVKFYIARLFKQIAREEFPELKRERDQMRRFF